MKMIHGGAAERKWRANGGSKKGNGRGRERCGEAQSEGGNIACDWRGREGERNEERGGEEGWGSESGPSG